MSPSNGSSKIRRIVRIRQMLMRWRKKAAGRAAADVPAGHVAVCVGPSMRRFIVRATHLNHPIFQKLLLRAEEEYGFCNRGPLAIPCDEEIFEELLRVMSRPESVFAASLEEFQRRCHVDFRSNGTGSGKNGGGGGGGGFDFVGESWPLLHDELIY
ncbi:hypothetical protein PIB30_018895 [Stylosanthes scabra]|uniref:Small auxin up regulated protein n=1 Tax=Stylosanthes scabra TaxID=79078 RepID=A0ABU6W867_9FABA|nr:hypothetical protein [Stylosanthes scabra]